MLAEVIHSEGMSKQLSRLQEQKTAVLGSQALPAPTQRAEQMSREGVREARAGDQSAQGNPSQWLRDFSHLR